MYLRFNIVIVINIQVNSCNILYRISDVDYKHVQVYGLNSIRLVQSNSLGQYVLSYS